MVPGYSVNNTNDSAVAKAMRDPLPWQTEPIHRPAVSWYPRYEGEYIPIIPIPV